MEYRERIKTLSFRILVAAILPFLIIWSLDGGGNYSLSIILVVFFAALLFDILRKVELLEKREKSLLDFVRDGEDTGIVDREKEDQILLEIMDFFRQKQRANPESSENNEERLYLRNIIQFTSIGLLTFDTEGKVQIFNTAARKLLAFKNPKHVDDFNKVSPILVEALKNLKTGGRDLVRLEIEGEIIQLSIYAIQLFREDKEYKLVSLQNIQSELEEKEMEAWQNLVRVLTHEIMNSITPITSLARTVETDVEEIIEEFKIDRSDEDWSDLQLALSTIRKRGEGLMRFVEDFRNLTKVPQPTMKEVKVDSLIEEVRLLMKKDLTEGKVEFVTEVAAHITLMADPELIVQVLINLVQNAIQAFEEEQQEKKIKIIVEQGKKSQITIRVIDNGPGIDEEALEKVFIPFFTTKKTGSGIGLSLSRQIMRRHKGMLGVNSTLDKGTEFFLKF